MKFYTSFSSNTSNSCIATSFPCVSNTRMENIHTRLKAARKAKGLSMQEMAPLVGVKSWQTIQQWEWDDSDGKKPTAPKRTRLEVVAKVLDVTVDYLLYGDAGPTGAANDPVYIPIEYYEDVPLSAGAGYLVVEWEKQKPLNFRADFLKKHASNPAKHVKAFPVKGDSLIDKGIMDGGVVLANISEQAKSPRHERIFALDIEGETFIKELVKVEDEWFARSHNREKSGTKEYLDRPLSDKRVTIIGRVFWACFEV